MAGILGPDGERFLWVMDPMTRKLRVPMSVIEPTQATAIPGTVPSLCMLFLDGRCRHPACRQVHISMAVLQQLRREAQQAPNCCGAHGDGRDRSLLTDHYAFLAISGPPNGTRGTSAPQTGASQAASPPTRTGPDGSHILTLPVERVAMTVGLQRYIAQSHPLPSPVVPSLKSPGLHPGPSSVPLSQVALQQYNQQFPPLAGDSCQRPAPSKDTSSSSTGETPEPQPLPSEAALPSAGDSEPSAANTLEIPLKMVCRLHLSKKCRYLEDCNNVHICREYEGKLPPPPAGGSQGPQHNAETLQALRSGTTATTMGSTSYNVVLIAPNSITDTEMHQLVTTHKLSYPQLQLRIIDVRTSSGSTPPPQGGRKDDAADGLSSASPSPMSPMGSNSAATRSPLQYGAAVPFDCTPPPFLKGPTHGMERPLAPPPGAPFQTPMGPAVTGMNNNSSIVASLLTGAPVGSPPPEASLPPHAQSSMKPTTIPVSPQRGSQAQPPLYASCSSHLPSATSLAGPPLPPPAYTQLPPGLATHAAYGGAPSIPPSRRL